MMPLRSMSSRCTSAPVSVLRSSRRVSMDTEALNDGEKSATVSPMVCSVLCGEFGCNAVILLQITGTPCFFHPRVNNADSEVSSLARLAIFIDIDKLSEFLAAIRKRRAA